MRLPMKISIIGDGTELHSVLSQAHRDADIISISGRKFRTAELSARWNGAAYEAVSVLAVEVEGAQWTGEGLPPVGTVCEFAGGTHCPDDPLDKDLKEGDQVTIIAHFKCGDFTLAAFTFDPKNPNRGMVQVEQGNYGCFRPIRTPEQIAAEERQRVEEEIQRICSDGENNGVPFFKALYDAGYRKFEIVEE